MATKKIPASDIRPGNKIITTHNMVGIVTDIIPILAGNHHIVLVHCSGFLHPFAITRDTLVEVVPSK